MKKILLLLLATAAVSCSSDNDSEDQPLIARYNLNTMHYPLGTPMSGDKVQLTYEGNQIVKRVGGVVPMDPASGFSYAFSSAQYDELTYDSDRITIVEKNTFYPDPSKKTEIVLDSHHQMSERINIALFYPQTRMDTIRYSYDASGLLTYSKKGKPSSEFEESQYYYNTHKNLDSIVTKHYFSGHLFYKIKETFSLYDTAANPIKNLYLFEETFLRSLSRNNYKHYEKDKFDFDNELTEHEDRNWVFLYDADGTIRFDL